MSNICQKCDGTICYIGFFKSKGHHLIINNEIIFDVNTPTIYYFFSCRYCDNDIELVNSGKYIGMTNNARITHKRRYEKIHDIKKLI